MPQLRKKLPSPLDHFSDQLLKMHDEQLPLVDMIAWLASQQVKTTSHHLSSFLARQRAARTQQSLLNNLADAAKHCATLEQHLDENAAPEMETVIKVFRTIIMQFATRETPEPEFLKLADQLARTAISFLSEQTKAAFKERELALTEQKFAESKKIAQARALEWCLDEAKKHTHVVEMFRAAFAALKSAQDGSHHLLPDPTSPLT